MIYYNRHIIFKATYTTVCMYWVFARKFISTYSDTVIKALEKN